jgi:hypothetical protein
MTSASISMACSSSIAAAGASFRNTKIELPSNYNGECLISKTSTDFVITIPLDKAGELLVQSKDTANRHRQRQSHLWRLGTVEHGPEGTDKAAKEAGD